MTTFSVGDETFEIRDWQEGDEGSIAAIYNQSIEAGDATMEETVKTPAGTLAMLQALGPRETVLTLNRTAGSGPTEVVGWGIIKKYSDREGYRFACETSVYLDRHQIAKGLGTKMKLAQIERCREWGYHHLVAKIFATNTASIEYNLKLGYERVGIQREIGFKDGAWQDVAILQLILKPTSEPTETRD